jgi:hypothetical protein
VRPKAVPSIAHRCLKAESLIFASLGLALLPTPLTRRHAHSDLVESFNPALVSANLFRIGVAHGSTRGILADGIHSSNPIAGGCAEQAGLDHLAPGRPVWHSSLVAPVLRARSRSRVSTCRGVQIRGAGSLALARGIEYDGSDVYPTSESGAPEPMALPRTRRTHIRGGLRVGESMARRVRRRGKDQGNVAFRIWPPLTMTSCLGPRMATLSTLSRLGREPRTMEAPWGMSRLAAPPSGSANRPLVVP